MPTKKKPLGRHDIPLKAFIDDARAAWYKQRHLAPSDGRPAVEKVRILDIFDGDLQPAIGRLVRWRDRHPDRQFLPISQGRLIEFVERRVGPTVSHTTIKDVVKEFRLKMRLQVTKTPIYTESEWAWLAKHATKSEKAYRRAVIEESRANTALSILRIDVQLATHPHERGLANVRKIRLSMLESVRQHDRILALLTSPPRARKSS